MLHDVLLGSGLRVSLLMLLDVVRLDEHRLRGGRAHPHLHEVGQGVRKIDLTWPICTPRPCKTLPYVTRPRPKRNLGPRAKTSYLLIWLWVKTNGTILG